MKPDKEIELIVAVARDGAIGRGGDLPFHLSPDLKHFKEITSGHTVVMGRRTFQSLPKGALPDRRNIVLSRDKSFSAPGAEIFPSLDEALASMAPAERIFIIGGGQLYAQTLPLASVIHLTEVDAQVEDADTFFPEIPEDEFIVDDVTEWREDPKSGLTYRFSTLIRRLHEKKSMDDLARVDVETFRKSDKLPLVMVLDDIRSTNNVGSIFRTCDAFAVDEILICGITAAPPSQAIHKTALGAERSVKWRSFDAVADAIAMLRANGYVIAVLEQVKESVDLFDFKPSFDKGEKYALVVGNEIKGVSQHAVNLADICLEIPQRGTKHSLNVAVSAALGAACFYKAYNFKNQ